METKANYSLVGAFVIVLIIGLVGFAVWISKVDFSNGALYDVYFDGSVSGLRKGESVSYNGLPLGMVSNIGVDSKNVQQILVTIRVDNPELIRESSFATIETKGLTGLIEIQIHGSRSDSPLLKAKPGQKRPVIKSVPSKVQQLIDGAPKLLQKITDLVDHVSTVFNKENTKNFTSVMASMAEFSKSLSAESKDMKGFFKNVKDSFAELKSGSAELSVTMKHFRGLIDENKTDINDFTTVGLKEVTNAMTQLRELSSSLSRVMQKAERGPLRYITSNDDNNEDLG